MKNKTATELTPWAKALEARDDLNQFKSSKIGLFVLALKYGVEDISAAAAESLVDGGGDKKNDVIFIDEELGRAVVMQCYMSTTSRAVAPSNKAGDLNTAMTWVLSTAKKDLPQEIKSQSIRLREAIASGSIKEICVLYVHNCGESENVRVELTGVQAGTRKLLDSIQPNGKNVALIVAEAGNETLDQWYQDTHSPIVVGEVIEFRRTGGFELNAPKWRAYVTAIRASELRDLYEKHKTDLFSANVRDYLGSRSSDSNINNGIKKTIADCPENFWVFNNGITALTHKYDARDQPHQRIILTGISIVNGAQTTGAIAAASLSQDDAAALVPVRFVATKDDPLIDDIVRFNNSQNQITASDFRSTDSIQRRLKREMTLIRDAEYEGGRRGGAADAIKRRTNLLSSYTVGQALAAFHGDALLAYNGKSQIWTNDKNYSDYFNDRTSARHIVFVYGLLKAIEEVRLKLRAQREKAPNSLKKSDQQHLEFFQNSGSIYVLMTALSESLEEILDDAIADKFNLGFGPTVSPKRAGEYWLPLVSAFLPVVTTLSAAFDPSLTRDTLKKAVQSFRTVAQMARGSNVVVIEAFAKRLK